MGPGQVHGIMGTAAHTCLCLSGDVPRSGGLSSVCSRVILWATYQNFRRVCCMPSPVLGAGIPEMDIIWDIAFEVGAGGP